VHALALSGVLLIRARIPDSPSPPTIIGELLVVDAGDSPSRTSVSAEPEAKEPPAPAPVAEPEPARALESPAREAQPEAVADANEHADSPDATRRALDAPANAEAEATENGNNPTAEPTAGESATTGPALAEHAAEESVGAGAGAEAAVELAREDDSSEAVPPPAPRSEPMPRRERAMLSERFASWTGELAAGEAGRRVAWKQNGRAYTAVFRRAPSGDPMGLERVLVDVSTEQAGKRMSTRLTMTRLSFSNFAQFVDRWDPEVQIHDDEIDGRFHSNTEIKLLSTGGVSPVFHGKVTLAAHDIDTESSWSFNRHRVFPDGLEMGVRRIVLPSRFLGMLNEAASGDANVQRFERDARIVFHDDGTYSWSYLRDGGEEERRAVTSPAHYLLGVGGVTLRIKGSVRGKVLVYADRILIDNDVRYAHAHDSPDLDDYLGLVAETMVEIAEPAVTGLGDLAVDASIYARREFAVREFRSRPSGTLRIFGSLTAGSLTATEPRFATKIEFDPRLKNARPPSFPLTDRYELESSDGEWRVDDAAGSSASGDGADDADAGAQHDDRSAATARN
jgi:hypothetical protein